MNKDYTLAALTDIWTGDADRRGDRTIPTGLLGAIRWWFEVLVRGLGGAACDPTDKDNRCPAPGKKPTDSGHRCVVCELFGCTGWARKFRFEILDETGKVKAAQIKKDQTFKLRFIELRPIQPVEWALLDLTLRLIAEYGAIGGKTVLKPSDEPSRANAAHHRDYELVHIVECPLNLPSRGRKQLEDYVRQHRCPDLAHKAFAWASLENFWCVKGRHLARQNSNASTFNRVIGRPEQKPQSHQEDSWLAGRRARRGANPQPSESKKVFSFKEPLSARRTFGFVNPASQTLDGMRQRLKVVWPDLNDEKFLTGAAILKRLLEGRGGSTP